MKQFNNMFSAHLKMMFREKQVWFWNIFFPIILMVIFMIIFGGNGSESSFKATVAVAVENGESSEASNALLEGLKQIPVFEWKEEQPIDRTAGMEWVENKDIDALIVLPANEGAFQLIVNRENEQGATAQTISSILNNFIQQANLSVVGAVPTYQMTLESVTSASDEVNYQDFLLTGMIGLSVAQGGLFGMVDLVDMRRRGLLKRLRMTPAKMGLFGLSSMLVRLIVGVVQIVILALVGVFGFGANLNINMFSLLIAFFAGALVFNAMGYLFSSFSKTIEAYMGMANIVSMLMMFLSGVFFPIESLPQWLQVVPAILPLTYFVEGMRDGMIYANGIFNSSFWLGMGIMAIWGIVCFLLASQIYRTKSIAATR